MAGKAAAMENKNSAAVYAPTRLGKAVAAGKKKIALVDDDGARYELTTKGMKLVNGLSNKKASKKCQKK